VQEVEAGDRFSGSPFGVAFMSTVLIVEDYPSNMQAFCLLFHSQGFRVLEATTEKEAMETGKRFPERWISYSVM
jgi:PleD family two-component response regulator